MNNEQLILELVNISKIFSNTKTNEKIEALTDISFGVKEGKFVSIIGPSGCGKTTLLRIISGLEQPSTGKIILKGKESEKPYDQVGLIFQEYALFPWRTVIDNIGFGLEIKNISSPSTLLNPSFRVLGSYFCIICSRSA